MSNLIIRQGESKDIDAIAAMEISCFSDPWSRESIRAEIEDNDLALYIVAEIDGEVVGYAGIWYIGDEGHITNVAVKPEYRQKNIGAAIISAMIDHSEKHGIKSFTLEVRVSNIPAQRLYEKFGFDVAGIRPRYYKDNEDAMIMWRTEE